MRFRGDKKGRDRCKGVNSNRILLHQACVLTNRPHGGRAFLKCAENGGREVLADGEIFFTF